MKCSLGAQVRGAQSSETSLNPVDSDPTSLEPILSPPHLPTEGSGLGGAVREAAVGSRGCRGHPALSQTRHHLKQAPSLWFLFLFVIIYLRTELKSVSMVRKEGVA